MDELVLGGLTFRAFHGFYEEERTEGNDFELTLKFTLDLTQAGQSDELQHTLNYERVYELVEEIMLGESVHLIEHLAYSIGEKLEHEFPSVHSFSVQLRKLTPPLNGSVAFSEVCLSWPR